MNAIQMADLTFNALAGRMPFDVQERSQWKVIYEDRETREEKEVTIYSKKETRESRIIVYVEEEYGAYVSMQRVS